MSYDKMPKMLLTNVKSNIAQLVWKMTYYTLLN